MVGPEILTEEGIKQQLVARRKAERARWAGVNGGQRGGTGGQPPDTHCWTGKGNLRGWLREIGKEDGEECR